jgi:hypothetical protein
MKITTKNNIMGAVAAFVLPVVAFTSGLVFTGCPPEPDDNNKGKDETPKPIEATLKIDGTYPHLKQGALITLTFPATYTETRINAILAKHTSAVATLDGKAGMDDSFKDQINAILDKKGLDATIVESDSITYGIKIVDGHLVMESAWIEHAGIKGANLYSKIVSLIEENAWVAKAPTRVRPATHGGCHRFLLVPLVETPTLWVGG